MTICDGLRQSVLQAAIQGKLTKQLPEDGAATDLLASIKAEKEQLIKEKKIKKEKPLVPISADEIPFDIPENWEWVHLEDIGRFGAGKTPDSDLISFYGKYPYFKVSDMNVAGNEKEMCVVKNWLGPEYSGTLFPKGSFIYPKNGGAVFTNKKRILVQDSLVDLNTGVYIPSNSVNQDFLFYLFSTLDFRHLYKGTALPTVDMDKVRSLIFPLPPLAEQHRIVARVNELMAKIDELETVEKELVALKKAFPGDMKASLLQAAMQGKLTQQLPEDGSAADLLASIKAEKDKLIAEKKIKKDSIEVLEDVPFDIPASWCWVRLNDIVVKTVKRGKSPTYTTKSNTLVFAQKCNTKAGYINMELALFLDEGKLNKYPDDEFMQDMDIVINSTGNGTLGRVGFFRNTDNPRELRIVPDSHVTVIRPSSQMNAAYAMYCMKYYQPYFEKTCTGSTNQTELSVDTLKNLAFPLPPLAEQKRIVEKLDKLLPLCDALKEDGMA